jgi:hypothetical protein
VGREKTRLQPTARRMKTEITRKTMLKVKEVKSTEVKLDEETWDWNKRKKT